jgi:hypothetical protein
MTDNVQIAGVSRIEPKISPVGSPGNVKALKPAKPDAVYLSTRVFRNMLENHDDTYQIPALENMARTRLPRENYISGGFREELLSMTVGKVAADLAAFFAVDHPQPSPSRGNDRTADIEVERQWKAGTVDISSIKPTLQRVREIADLPVDWDSYGGRETTAVAVAEVSQLLVRSLHFPLPQNNVTVDVAPLPDGGVIVEWEAPARRLQVWVHGNGSRSGVVIETEDGEDVNWIDLTDISDEDLIREYHALVGSTHRV